ncbi:MAG: L,D-transpeptidase family protein [Clostridia bacterium]|nr:L,D-transpeptidase family protein [Clostridia bacterium]
MIIAGNHFFLFSVACAQTHNKENVKTTKEAEVVLGQETQKAIQESETTEAMMSESSTVDEELVESKSGYITDNDICTQDEYEKTLFSQPISVERNGEMRLGIKCTVGSHAVLSIYEAQDGKYVSIFSCEAMIGKNGTVKHAEGDTKTPLGTWKIGNTYGLKDDPGSRIPYQKLDDDAYWCATGSNGKNYNTLLDRKDDPDGDYSEDEHIADYPIRYAYFLDLGYNKAGVPYAGNAIFLHCWKDPDFPTGGCVAVSEDDMVKILKILKPGSTVTIY